MGAGIYAANKSAGCWKQAEDAGRKLKDAGMGRENRAGLLSQDSGSVWFQVAQRNPQVYVLVVWFLNVTLVLKVLSSWLVEMLGKGQGTPKSWPAHAAPSWHWHQERLSMSQPLPPISTVNQ